MTGDLEIASRLRASGVEVAVRYAGADEWYAVEGSPIELDDSGSSLDLHKLHELHERIVGRLTTSGPMVDGNEDPVSLLSFPTTAGDG